MRALGIVIALVLTKIVLTPTFAWMDFLPIGFLFLSIKQKDIRICLLERNYKLIPVALMCLFIGSWSLYTSYPNSSFTILSIVSILFIQAFDEEVIFRKYFFTQLHSSLSRRMWITSLVFSLLHIPALLSGFQTGSPVFTILFQVLIRFMLGMVLCFLYERYQSLLLVSSIHFLMNALASSRFGSIAMCFDFGMVLLCLMIDRKRWMEKLKRFREQ